jgi:hypothetical protein
MNAIELLAKQLSKTKGIKWGILCNNDTAEAISIKLDFIEQVKSLLSLCYPCTNDDCQHGKVPFIEWDDDGKEIKGYNTCLVCNGTGLSDKKILAVLPIDYLRKLDDAGFDDEAINDICEIFGVQGSTTGKKTVEVER